MDPLTHALAGATIAWAASGARLGRRALLVGGAAALLPDLDVLIRSADDPLLAIEHHRGFTHSLVFAPVGGALTALLLGGKAHRRRAVLAGILAWLSHALLDAATTYGTQLLWPFSRLRTGLDIISIVDPLFTLILLTGVIAAFRARRRLVTAMLVLATVWLAIGFVQRERATAAQRMLAQRRGERVARAAVFPTIGNTIVWRSVYETNGMLRLDRIRVPWTGAPSVAEGTTVPLARNAHPDFARFAWFSDGWVAADPADPTILGDARYSLDSSRYRPVWGIRLGARTEWVDRSRERRVSAAELWREITGRDPAFR
jgi:inner membrane protein